ncbi:MAG: hypothetical protein OXN86_00615 [Chloroflexota bacterium]|nr:hypothetical protein [Chloroflexota bacterium]
MCALSHYIERGSNGRVATTGISLIRRHPEGMKPPRSLWVPFPLGRPLGSPDHPDFQRDVLLNALQLLETATEPTIDDYPQDAPISGDDPWACAIMVSPPEPADETEALRDQLVEEIRQLAPWHRESINRRGRTTVGISGATVEQMEDLAVLLADFATGTEPSDGEIDWNHPMPARLKFASDDLRAFYHESATAQPGAAYPTDADLNDWLFNQTLLGTVLRQIVGRMRESEDRRVSGMVIGMIPAGFARAR